MDEDDIEINDSLGETVSGESLFGADPDSLGVDSSTADTPYSTYDIAAAESAALEAGQFEAEAFGFTWVFDDIIGDFVVNGKEPVRVDGLEAFAEWVANLLGTERRLYRVFDEDFGIDQEQIFGSNVGSYILPSFLRKEIEDALRVHNRFESLDDFQFTQDGDTVTVTLIISTTAGQIELSTNLAGAAAA